VAVEVAVEVRRGVFPLERCGGGVVGVDEGQQRVREPLGAGEVVG
jgi:hypothetical protein